MEQKSEQIDLEYVVQFEDGLRPKVRIYGIDTEAEEIYVADAIVGVSVGIGYCLSQPSREDFGRILAMIQMNSIRSISSIVTEFRAKLPEVENWEQGLYNVERELGHNVIRIQNPNHIGPALDRHAQLYGKQFIELEKIFKNIFKGFIEEHPGFGKY